MSGFTPWDPPPLEQFDLGVHESSFGDDVPQRLETDVLADGDEIVCDQTEAAEAGIGNRGDPLTDRYRTGGRGIHWGDVACAAPSRGDELWLGHFIPSRQRASRLLSSSTTSPCIVDARRDRCSAPISARWDTSSKVSAFCPQSENDQWSSTSESAEFETLTTMRGPIAGRSSDAASRGERI